MSWKHARGRDAPALGLGDPEVRPGVGASVKADDRLDHGSKLGRNRRLLGMAAIRHILVLIVLELHAECLLDGVDSSQEVHGPTRDAGIGNRQAVLAGELLDRVEIGGVGSVQRRVLFAAQVLSVLRRL